MAGTMHQPQDRKCELSQTLVDARRRAGGLASFPGPLPGSLSEAYAVQSLSRAGWPDRVIGWKVGGIPPQHRAALGEDRLSGPIFARRLASARAGETSPMPVFADGFAAIEPEFVLQLGDTRERDRLYVGVEIASSPLVAINDIGPLAVVCDFGNNNGLLIGNEIADWQGWSGRPLEVIATINGVEVGRKEEHNLPLQVALARDFLFDLAKREGLPVGPGQYISTGAITGVHDARCGDRSVLDFGEFGTIEIELVPEQPLP